MVRCLLMVDLDRPCNFPHGNPGLEIEPREYQILTKSRIQEVFETHMGAGALDHRPYLAAASVLPMRTNNYVVSLSQADAITLSASRICRKHAMVARASC